MQSSIDLFVVPKSTSTEPFQPIDVNRESTILKKRGRGRPPKPKPLVKKVKGENGSIQEVQDANIQEIAEEESIEESNEAKRGIYNKIPFKMRKEIIEEYINFSKKKQENAGTVIAMSFNDFSKELSTKMGVKLQTLRRICFDYDKNPNIYIHLQVLCSNQKKAAQKGNIKVRDSPLTYNKDLDLELYDWVTCSIDLGLHITRENIQQKAR